jgi:hypothetical protein
MSLLNRVVGYQYISSTFYVTLESSVFQSPSTGQFKTPDPGLENLGHQNAWDADMMFLVKTLLGSGSQGCSNVKKIVDRGK